MSIIQVMIDYRKLTINFCTYYVYHIVGNFRGVLIFVIFVVDLAVMKISNHEINDY